MDNNIIRRKRFAWLTVSSFTLLHLAGCEAPVQIAISAVNRNYSRQEEERLDRISIDSQRRYKAMADAGDPKGLYYMAFLHAAKHMEDEPDSDAHAVKRMYEEAMARGSNDARAALGNMLVCGSTGILWGVSCLAGLPRSERDPQLGVALLKQAAENSCSVTQPLIAIGSCRERETSIPRMLWIIYRDGKGGITKDPGQEAHWRKRDEACTATIERINRQRGCLK